MTFGWIGQGLKAGGARLRRIAREPLLQFLVAGAALFGADHAMRSASEDADPKRIEVTQNEVRQLSVAWLAQGRPAPTPAQLKGLVDQKVAMEILVREAKDLGLDRDDEVIKRRLAQKMDFLFEDAAKAREPTEAELRDWFSNNADRFAEPPRIDFHHLYFALDRGRTDKDVAAIKVRIDGRKDDDATAEIAAADQFMFQDVYTDTTPDQIAKTFGPGFAKAVFSLPKGGWQGPIASGYGWHLVYVDALVPAALPKFEAVEPQVKTAWLDEQTQTLKRKTFDELKSRYTVVTPPLDDPSLVAPSAAETGPSP